MIEAHCKTVQQRMERRARWSEKFGGWLTDDQIEAREIERARTQNIRLRVQLELQSASAKAMARAAGLQTT